MQFCSKNISFFGLSKKYLVFGLNNLNSDIHMLGVCSRSIIASSFPANFAAIC